MAKISFKSSNPRDEMARRNVFEVLGIPNEGPSPRGSTYHKMLLICPREWGLYYKLGLRPTVLNEPLTVGWTFHYCLQRYYEAIQRHQQTSGAKVGSDDYYWGGSNDGMAAAYEIIDRIEPEPGYVETVATLRRILDGYFEHYHHRDKWEIVAVEETLMYEGAFEYSARLDTVVEDHTRGGLWLVEHKTARFISMDLIDNYQLDLQILGQVWLVHACVDLEAYPDFRGVVINIATKHKEPQFTRVDVCPSPAHLAAFEQSVGNFQAIRTTMEALDWPQYLGHCSGYARGYDRCQFYDVCMGHPRVTVDEWAAGQKEGLDVPFGFELVEKAA